jgi:hypothetical protein
MQEIRSRFNSLGISFYNLYKATFTNNPLRPYVQYSINTVRTQFPKIAYQNTFEPEYTKPLVKHNVPIVLGLILTTIWASRVAVAEE